MKHYTTLSLSILLSASAIHAQHQANTWYFGHLCGLDFLLLLVFK